MIAITTSNSISVKPRRFDECMYLGLSLNGGEKNGQERNRAAAGAENESTPMENRRTDIHVPFMKPAAGSLEPIASLGGRRIRDGALRRVMFDDELEKAMRYDERIVARVERPGGVDESTTNGATQRLRTSQAEQRCDERITRSQLPT
ncbi:MAG: hypothetical protein P4L85_01800 [Paludisphaera borealis]|uniref:hypothetical protein n=1 Tax=Paludisphaera borealis TaxID=1387353 RepID=UPI002846F4CD|nr:hypothetical protein [Paludisphaera borealis]MDR3618054.1 hypothetical protein [Paludisphaera borealis]